MKTAILAATLLAALCSQAAAEETRRTAGNWETGTNARPFDEDVTVFASMTQNGHTIGLHCIDRQVSVLLMDMVPVKSGHFAEDMEAEIKFRADGNPIIETMGLGLDRVSFEVYAPVEMVLQIARAKELAFHISYSGTTADWVFQTDRALAALVDVTAACHAPVPAPR